MGDKVVPRLIDWIGGPSRIEELIERFYDAVLEDSLLGAALPRDGGETLGGARRGRIRTTILG